MLTFIQNRLQLDQIQSQDNKIQALNTNDNLILEPTNLGHVEINDNLLIRATPMQMMHKQIPTASADGTIVYSTGLGGSGLFFVNSSSTNDEIISNNRSSL